MRLLRLAAGMAASGLIAAVLIRPVSTQPSLGRVSFPNSGPSSAQSSFLRGVLLLHSFEYDEAIDAFREAQRLAPGFAMAYWGEAMCYDQPLWHNENIARARDALARLAPTRAARATKAPTAREKGYLDAVERLFGDGERPARLTAYVDRMAALVRDYPEDEEASVLLALALLGTIPEGARNPELSLRAGALASAVLKSNPQHPGAAHYALHAYDDGEHNRLGLEAARTYAKIAPASSHALHMPSHVFLPLGMWDEAAASDEASFNASIAWVKRTGRTVAQEDFHSLSWLHYEYLQQGRFLKAHEAADVVARALAEPGAAGPPGPPLPSRHHVESEIGRGFDPASLRNELASMRARSIIESEEWSRMRAQGTFGNIDELFAVGFSSVKLGDLARADAAIEHLRMAGRTITDRDGREVATIMAGQLTGVAQMARGDRKNGLTTLARTVELEARRPPPIARPYPIKPAAELYGEALLRAGNPRTAAARFQSALARTPQRARALLGLARAAHAAGLASDASSAARTFLDMWHAADGDGPEIAEMQRILRSAQR